MQQQISPVHSSTDNVMLTKPQTPQTAKNVSQRLQVLNKTGVNNTKHISDKSIHLNHIFKDI